MRKYLTNCHTNATQVNQVLIHQNDENINQYPASSISLSERENGRQFDTTLPFENAALWLVNVEKVGGAVDLSMELTITPNGRSG